MVLIHQVPSKIYLFSHDFVVCILCVVVPFFKTLFYFKSVGREEQTPVTNGNTLDMLNVKLWSVRLKLVGAEVSVEPCKVRKRDTPDDGSEGIMFPGTL